MKVLFINNTISEFHIGCYGVSKTIIDDIYRKYTTDCTIISIYTSQLKCKTIEALKKIYDEYDFEQVILNGEGSLHTKNIEGKKIFDLLSHIQNKVNRPNVSIINASIYDLPSPWLNLLDKADCLEVRDLESKRYLSEHKIDSVFKPDRLFRFLATSNLKNDCQGFDKDNVLVFDSVDKNHASIVNSLNLSGNSLFYGTVDLDPLWLLLNKSFVPRSFRDYKDIVRFYLKIMVRIFKYRNLKGNKFISNFDFNPLLVEKTQTSIVTARYHVVVLCIYYGIDFQCMKSNTKKIQSLLDYISNEFIDVIEIADDENNSDVKHVKFNRNHYRIQNYIDSYNYGV